MPSPTPPGPHQAGAPAAVASSSPTPTTPPPSSSPTPPPPSRPLRSAEHAELQRQGAKSASRGEALAANPMLDALNQPEATGETLQVWIDRRDAWTSGHQGQHRGASATPDPAGRGARQRRLQDLALFGVTRVLTFADGLALTSASGFLFERDGRLFLVTSRHVLFDPQNGHLPNRVEIELHTDPHDLTRLTTLSLLLYRNGLAAWRQARDSGGEVDVAALEIDPSGLAAGDALRAFGPQHLTAGFDLFEVGDRLAIPGFPLGFFDTVHHLPVVRQASIASSFGVRFQGLGYFLTDARLHRGCSGSPVLARLEMPGTSDVDWCLLGVHSSRMDMASRDLALDESLGLNCAWYADILLALTQ